MCHTLLLLLRRSFMNIIFKRSWVLMISGVFITLVSWSSCLFAGRNISSSTVQPLPVTPTAATSIILVYDIGVQSFGSSNANSSGSFSTTRKCPINYQPFFTLLPNISNPSGNGEIVLTYTSPPISGNTNYTVNFKSKYGTMGNAGLAFSWVMYCYPPGRIVPTPM